MSIAREIFEHHYNYYREIGIETIKQQDGQIEQVSADYQGRVIFELLQNAFDKAEHKILVKVIDNNLYIANDGKKFTYRHNYDYKKGNSTRDDFQSLCSISTSNKSVNTSIGNKGVGFKSVYSLAKGGYVDIYTKGLIHANHSEEHNIYFRLYDSFRDIENIPSEFDKSILALISEKIEYTQRERKDRGVPGYYFPMLLTNADQQINFLFTEGYVTVIKIEFSDFNKQLKPLIDEIKKVHFHFIQLRYENAITVFFEINGETFTKQNYKSNPPPCISATLNEKVQTVAKEAGVDIINPKVSFSIRDTSSSDSALLYNYLPTQIKSPFRYVDFHADFHTTVDRKSISFDGKIGQYNRLLLRACIELYFYYITKYIDSTSQVHLNLNYISVESTKLEAHDYFNWKLLDSNNDIAFDLVRTVLFISSRSYGNASTLFALIAKKYFKSKQSLESHKLFFSRTMTFIDTYGRGYGELYDFLKQFKEQFANALRTEKSPIIPTDTVSIALSDELFYRDNSKQKSIVIPSFIGLKMTDFNIEDKDFKKALNIREFTDYNDLLRYFKQATYTGKVSKEKFSETNQKILLKSLIEIYKNKRELFDSSTHRFSRMYSLLDRQNNTNTNRAYFNISTIFLKTNNGKYKPAQLCRKNELDISFIPSGINEQGLDSFLKFIGVSIDSNYIFADWRLYTAFRNGISYIPAIVNDKNPDDKLNADEALSNISIINSKGERTHPALVNDNDYPFLKNISNNNIRKELSTLLIKKYDSFPTEYLTLLSKTVQNCPPGLERLYPRIFHTFHKTLGIYLVKKNKKLQWLKKTDLFYISQNKEDYERLINTDLPVLCYSDKTEIPTELLTRVITLVEGKIQHGELEDITKSINYLLNERMVYILIAISHSPYSDLNYIEDSSKIRALHESLRKLKVYSCDELSRHITCNNVDVNFADEYHAIVDFENYHIYFSKGCSSRKKAEAIAKYLFNNSRITNDIEIILFLKQIENLNQEFLIEDIDFFRSLWLEDFNKKFEEFKQCVFKIMGITDDKDIHWYQYNALHKSKILIELDRTNRINDFRLAIEQTKQEFVGYFDNFQLDINYSLNDEAIAKMIDFLEKTKNDATLKLVEELRTLSRKIGNEERLKQIEVELRNDFGFGISPDANSTKSSSTVNRINFDRQVVNILDNLSKLQNLIRHNYQTHGNASKENIPINRKKIIFQGTNMSGDNTLHHVTGASGEEQVLGYYIIEFLKMQPKTQIQAINEMYDLLKIKLGNESHKTFRDECLRHINNNDKLKAALIPFMYISLSHNFSYFDLIAYENNRPIIVEVKTTQNTHNKSFYISLAEINEARFEDNYQIVRVTPIEIIFMGNPIKILGDKINSIQGNNYRLIPRNFKFEFTN